MSTEAAFPGPLRAVLGQSKPGATVAANGKGRHTAEAPPLFVPGLPRPAERIGAAPACYEISPGGNARHGRLGR